MGYHDVDVPLKNEKDQKRTAQISLPKMYTWKGRLKVTIKDLGNDGINGVFNSKDRFTTERQNASGNVIPEAEAARLIEKTTPSDLRIQSSSATFTLYFDVCILSNYAIFIPKKLTKFMWVFLWFFGFLNGDLWTQYQHHNKLSMNFRVPTAHEQPNSQTGFVRICRTGFVFTSCEERRCIHVCLEDTSSRLRPPIGDLM